MFWYHFILSIICTRTLAPNHKCWCLSVVNNVYHNAQRLLKYLHLNITPNISNILVLTLMLAMMRMMLMFLLSLWFWPHPFVFVLFFKRICLNINFETLLLMYLLLLWFWLNSPWFPLIKFSDVRNRNSWKTSDKKDVENI